MSKADLFLELAKPDEHGFSKPVPTTKFIGKYDGLTMGNGGSWCREDGALGKKFNVIRIKEKNKIVAVKLEGFKKNPIQKPIPQHIRKQLENKKCVVLGISNVEIDHKDGRRDDPRLSDASKVMLADFQPLSKAANNAKRQHCKECRKTDKRFDAKKLGYTVSQVKGNGTYHGTCVGCFWHDPIFFRQEIGKK